MAYEFRADEAVDVAVRRIAEEQVDAARRHLDVAASASSTTEDATPGDDPVEDAVHEARKCCKRIRGLVRLVRPALGDHYTPANRHARDAARELSAVRDAHAQVATFDALVAARSDQVPRAGLVPVRRALVERAVRATARLADAPERLERARDHLHEVSAVVADWPLGDTSGDDQLGALAAGVTKTATRAHDRFAEVVDLDGVAGDELLHQWRKRVKYSWYHASLLEPAAPTLLGTHADLLHDLADALGDDHDLAVLATDLQHDPDRWGGRDVVDGALVLVDGTRRDLQRRAVAVGARVHAEDPGAMGHRFVALLQAWWTHGPERPSGELDDLHPPADDLGDRTAGQLRELARDRDLPGRSDMDRATLLAALRADGAA